MVGEAGPFPARREPGESQKILGPLAAYFLGPSVARGLGQATYTSLMKVLEGLFLIAALTCGGRAWAASAPAAPAAAQRSPKTERDTLLASMKNFALLIAASGDLKELPQSAYPTHDAVWYAATLKSLQDDATANADPDVAAMDGFQKRYDALKQNFIDQVYDACPKCYRRDRRNAITAMQIKEDEAIDADRFLSRPALTPAQRAFGEQLQWRINTMSPFALKDVRDDMNDAGLPRAPLTEVATPSGTRHFRDLLRQPPVLPTAGPRAGSNVPPPPIGGDWHPNQWVSKANWADYKLMVPWVENVLRQTGTYDLMAANGIKPVEYTLALISSESSFYRGATSNIRNRTTGAVTHAYGFMQLLQGTAKRVLAGSMDDYRRIMAADTDSPQKVLTPGQLTGAALKRDWKTNVFIGVAYLKQHIEEFSARLRDSGITAPGETGPILQGLVASAYNAGEGAVRKYWERLDVALRDPSASIVPYAETRNYVRKISAMTLMDWTGDGSPMI